MSALLTAAKFYLLFCWSEVLKSERLKLNTRYLESCKVERSAELMFQTVTEVKRAWTSFMWDEITD